MKLTKSVLKRLIKEEISVLVEAKYYADMSEEELLDTMKSTTYQKVYLFAKGELKKREYEGKYPAGRGEEPKSDEEPIDV
tara:strand:- start:513 stop:752 length:240 start_codon:yes stop_codon:yes gene_type:complete